MDFLFFKFICLLPIFAMILTKIGDIKFGLISSIFLTIWSIEFVILEPQILRGFCFVCFVFLSFPLFIYWCFWWYFNNLCYCFMFLVLIVSLFLYVFVCIFVCVSWFAILLVFFSNRCEVSLLFGVFWLLVLFLICCL